MLEVLSLRMKLWLLKYLFLSRSHKTFSRKVIWYDLIRYHSFNFSLPFPRRESQKRSLFSSFRCFIMLHKHPSPQIITCEIFKTDLVICPVINRLSFWQINHVSKGYIHTNTVARTRDDVSAVSLGNLQGMTGFIFTSCTPLGLKLGNQCIL